MVRAPPATFHRLVFLLLVRLLSEVTSLAHSSGSTLAWPAKPKAALEKEGSGGTDPVSPKSLSRSESPRRRAEHRENQDLTAAIALLRRGRHDGLVELSNATSKADTVLDSGKLGKVSNGTSLRKAANASISPAKRLQNSTHRMNNRTDDIKVIHRKQLQLTRSLYSHWARKSVSAGPNKELCEGPVTVRDEAKMLTCAADNVERFRKLSRVFAKDAHGIASLAKHVVLLGDNESLGLNSCVTGGPAKPEGRLRFVVDSQYTNQPRCCNKTEIDGLSRDPSGDLSPWTKQALSAMKVRKQGGIEYRKLEPTTRPCTAEAPCPLVIHLGDFNTSWFLIQGHCEVCSKLLGAVLLSLALPQDLPDAHGTGKFVGTSWAVLRDAFLPFVANYMKKHKEVDPEKVYLVGVAQGEDTALRVALMRPDMFSVVSLSGKLRVSSETLNLLKKDTKEERWQQKRLHSLMLSVGDQDDVFADDEFYPAIKDVLSVFNQRDIHVELRVYPDSKRTIWWAAWNTFHEVLWSGKRRPFEEGKIPVSCMGTQMLEA